MEGVLEKNIPKNMETLKTMEKLEKLLLEVNFGAEAIPEYSFEKVLLLLNDINGEALSSKEKELLHELISANND